MTNKLKENFLLNDELQTCINSVEEIDASSETQTSLKLQVCS